MSQSNLNFPFSNILRNVYSKFVYKINVPSVTGTGSKRILPCGCWFLIGQKEESEVFRTVHFSSVTQSCPTLCDPMNRSTPGLPVHHQLPEFTQTHIHRVSDAIQPSHPLSSPSPALNPSQHRRFFQ